MTVDDFVKRVNQFIAFAEQTLQTAHTREGFGGAWVDEQMFNQFRASSLSFLSNVFGEDHIFYTEFTNKVGMASPAVVKIGQGLLYAVKEELEGGWLRTTKGLISADIFADFLEMASHLLEERYKDPAAVMTGGVLEEHLRQLCTKHSIAIEVPDAKGRPRPKKAETMNQELVKARANGGSYSGGEQKQVTAWLDLRNDAAHGHYDKYDIPRVQLMVDGVRAFITRIPV